MSFLCLASALGFAQASQPDDAPPLSGTVSLYELEHKIPPQALKEGRAADRSRKKNDLAAYIEHAEKAVAIDPDYLVARRNLGVAYIMEGQSEKAAEQFHEILKRDPHSLAGYAALSCAYLQMKKFEDAETAARRALTIDSGNLQSHYFLGISLTLQQKNLGEALQHLAKAAHRFPKAHLASAEIMEHLGMNRAAKGELESYLSSGEEDARPQAEQWLSALH